MAIPRELEGILDADPAIISGAVRFVGTRVPVQALFDTLDDGDGISAFLDGYPGVTREQAAAVIRWEQNRAREAFGLEVIA
jgi:uncharacterized protein (DUF433 family)